MVTLIFISLNELSFINVDLLDNDSPLNLIVDKSKWKTKIENNNFKIDISLNAYINLNLTNLQINEIKEKLNEKIKKDVTNTLKLA